MISNRSARELERERLPVIDLDAAPSRVAREIDRACEEIGFFFVANHGVPPELVESVFSESRRFHALPEKEKAALAINEFHRGYIGLASYRLNEELGPNLSESLVLMHELEPDDPRLLAREPLQGPNQWPPLPGFCEVMLKYVSRMEELGNRLLAAFARALSLEEGYFESMFRHPTTFLRLLRYPPQETSSPENQFGSAPHTDYGAITMLAQDASGGLHVRHRSGDWVAATPLPDTFVVNIGDVMARWTNDRYVSTQHRVINASGGERFSVPFFFDPNTSATVECIPTCQGPDNPSRYPSVTYGDYLLSRLDAHYAYRKRGASL